MLTGTLEQYSFDKISGGRTRGQENLHHHYRKGIAGDWQNYFSETTKQYFKEHFNDVLIHLDYEKDDDW